MKTRNLVFLALLLASLLMISATSANENITDADILAADETSDDIEQISESDEAEEELMTTSDSNDEVLTSANPQGELTVFQEISKSKANVGDNVIIKITIKNTGTTTLDLVRVTPTDTNGLIFKSYEGASWNQEPDSFIYADELQPGQTATLYLTYTAEKTGTLTFSYEVTSNDTASIEKSISVEVSDSTGSHDKASNNTHVADTRNTGNPIFLLLIAICSIIPIRKFK